MRQVQFQTISSKSPAELDMHRTYSRGLGLTPPKALTGKLAIVGGGASALRHIEELRVWPGEIWALNGAAKWCAENLIEAVLFSVSPAASPQEAFQGLGRAILADTCHPSTFDALTHADVAIFDNEENGPTSAVAAMMLGIGLGASKVELFGCEGAYGATTHHYQDTPIPSDMLVSVGSTCFRTNVGYFLQSQILAHACRNAPGQVNNRSGGLFAALVSDPDGWDVIRLPSEMPRAA